MNDAKFREEMVGHMSKHTEAIGTIKEDVRIIKESLSGVDLRKMDKTIIRHGKYMSWLSGAGTVMFVGMSYMLSKVGIKWPGT